MASNPDPSLRKRAVELILKARKIQNLYKSERLSDLSEDYAVSTNTAMRRFPKRMTYAVVSI